MGLKEFFKPRQNKFLQLLIRQAEKTLEGMDALEEILALHPESPEAMQVNYLLGDAYFRAKEFEKAGAAYERYLAADPPADLRSCEAKVNLGICHFEAGVQADADKVLSQVAWRHGVLGERKLEILSDNLLSRLNRILAHRYQ